jgi:hypothetical protein
MGSKRYYAYSAEPYIQQTLPSPAAFSSIIAVSVVWWSEFLAADPEVQVRFQALQDFMRRSGSGTGSTQPREYNRGATWKKK